MNRLLLRPTALLRALRRPYELLASLWLALIFGERLVAHLLAYRKAASVGDALQRTSVIFCLLITWLLMLVALSVDRDSARVAIDRMGRFLRGLLKGLASANKLVAVLLVVGTTLLVRGALVNEPIGSVARKAMGQVAEEVRKHLTSGQAKTAGGLLVLYVIALVFERILRRGDRPLDQALYELNIGGFIIAVNAALYFWVNLAALSPEIREPGREEAVSGLLKDTVIYSLVALAIVVGTAKVVQSLRGLREAGARWAVVGAIAAGTLFGVVETLRVELHYKDTVLPTSKEYPDESRAIIGQHIMIRAFGLFIPLISVACLRMFLAAERVNREQAEAKKGGRAGGRRRRRPPPGQKRGGRKGSR